MPQIVNIAIDRLFPHADNPRKDLGDLSELAASIKASGILQNLTVVPDEPDNSNTDFTIIIGHRRYAAAKIAGLTELPCVVVEMSEREQLQTMLVENMQRSDLTVYEQAQGFQMMLNMGDSVAEIAEKSGFSQTTIRRRVKLLDLDRQKFQKAYIQELWEEEGSLIPVYYSNQYFFKKLIDLELDKLDSPEDKNKALDAIGTANFNSVLKSLISEQEIQKKLAEWTEIADKFAYQIERSGEFNGTTVNMVYHAGYSRWDLKKEMTIPEDASDVRYFYRKDSTGITLYRERQQSQQPDPEAEAREERRRRDEQAENEFAEAAEAHFELRKDFIKELPNSVFKQHMKEIALFCVATTESIDDGYCNSINPRFCAQLLGMRLSPDDENEDFCDMGFVRSAAEAQPEKLIFCCCYSALDDEDMSYYRRVWNMNHYEYELCENSDLDHIYEILETLGYEKSDDEEEMAEGTHRLFDTYGAQPDKTAEDSDDV